MSTLTRLLLAAGLCFAIPRAASAEDADAYYKQGIAYKQEGKSDQAIASFEHAVAANPKHYMAWASLGNLYKTARKDIPKAVTAYEHAVENGDRGEGDRESRATGGGQGQDGGAEDGDFEHDPERPVLDCRLGRDEQGPDHGREEGRSVCLHHAPEQPQALRDSCEAVLPGRHAGARDCARGDSFDTQPGCDGGESVRRSGRGR